MKTKPNGLLAHSVCPKVMYSHKIFFENVTHKARNNRKVELKFSSVVRRKGESQNGCFKKTKHVEFSEKRTFTP